MHGPTCRWKIYVSGRHSVVNEIGEKVLQNKMCLYYLWKHCSLILLQMVMVSPRTQLASENICVSSLFAAGGVS